MPKEVLIYGSIDECSSAGFIEEINEALELNASEEICVRINSNGGSPEYTWGMIAKFNELTGVKTVKNDGKSHSMALFFNCYVEKSSALDVSNFLLHRAAYPSWIENDENYFNDAMKANLASINKSLRTAFEAKVDVAKFENLKSVKDKGITLDQVFSMDSRIDVLLTAKEAKQIGLITEIVTITPKIKAEIESLVNEHTVSINAFYNDNKNQNQNQKNKIMTIETLKAEHPALFASVVALGVTAEKDRVGSIMAFNDIDPIAVKAAIESGNVLSETQKSEFTIKAIAKISLDGIKKDATEPAATSEVTAKTEAELAKEAFLADLKKGI